MAKWMEELDQQVKAKTAHTFFLYGNVADDVLYEKTFLRLYQAIPQIFKHSGVITFFNFASGLRFATTEMEKVFLQLIIKPIVDRIPVPASDKPTLKDYFEARKRGFGEVLEWLNNLLMMGWKAAAERLPEDAPDWMKNYLKEYTSYVEGIPFAVAVFEYQESKTPPGATTGSSSFDRTVVEIFQWWAQLPEIMTTDNVILLISDFLGLVAQELHRSSKGIISVKIDLPDRDEEEAILRMFKEQGVLLPSMFSEGEHDIGIKEIARVTAGLSAVEVGQILRQARARKETLTTAILFQKKAEVIKARLGDLVEMMMPAWGWEVIGGMNEKVFLGMMWVEAMKRGNIARLPKGGILLAGAPGTGKTVFGEAFARECGIPFIKVKNTYNQYVGVSEQNMQELLDTARANAPCVLFIDEFDEFVMQRGAYDGSGGTFTRTARMIREFLSDPTIHGKVIPFAATNRPDLIDTAMKRTGRFGAKLTFHIPRKEERPAIWEALFLKEQKRLALAGIALDISHVMDDSLLTELSAMADFWEDREGRLMCGPPRAEDMLDPDVQVIPLTGAQMEFVVGLSLQPTLQIDSAFLTSRPLKTWVNLIHEKFPLEEQIALSGTALKDAMRKYLPEGDIKEYRAMEELALRMVDNLDFIPQALHDRVRKLRLEKRKTRPSL